MVMKSRNSIKLKSTESTKQLKTSHPKLALGGSEIDENNIRSILETVLRFESGDKKGISSEIGGAKNDLLSDEGYKIYVQVNGIKLARRTHFVKCRFPHGVSVRKPEMLLIVKDLDKDYRADHEPTKLHFEDLLKSAGVSREIVREVLPFRALRTEYQTFQSKISLANKYDKVLTDDRIIHRLPPHLGKAFYKRKRFPYCVKMKSKNLLKDILTVANTMYLPLNNNGTTACVNVGESLMHMDKIMENIMYLIEILKSKYPGGWKNVRSLYVRKEGSMSLPLYISHASVKEVGFVDVKRPKDYFVKAVVDELSTFPGSQVKVFASGKVKIKRSKDENWDFEADAPFISGSEEETEDEETENKTSADNTEKKMKKRSRENDELEPSKKVKMNSEDEEKEEEEEIYRTELEFMKKVALEEEEMERRNKEIPCDDTDANAEVIVDGKKEEEEESGEDDEDNLVFQGKPSQFDDELEESKPKIQKKSKKERRKEIKNKKQKKLVGLKTKTMKKQGKPPSGSKINKKKKTTKVK